MYQIEAGAPIIGDGRYGRRRSDIQELLAQRIRTSESHGSADDSDADAISRLLRCTQPLLLHCNRVGPWYTLQLQWALEASVQSLGPVLPVPPLLLDTTAGFAKPASASFFLQHLQPCWQSF